MLGEQVAEAHGRDVNGVIGVATGSHRQVEGAELAVPLVHVERCGASVIGDANVFDDELTGSERVRETVPGLFA